MNQSMINFSTYEQTHCAHNPLVSILMPTYNHEEFIREALNSIISQNIDFPIEILIGDDCSSDRTREICLNFKQEHPQITKLFFNEHNIGLLKNYKNLIANSKGRYLAILESDDFWCDTDKLSTQISFLENNPQYGVVYTNANFLYEDSKLYKNKVQYKKPTGYIFEKLLKGNFIIAGTACIRKSLIDKYIFIDDYIELGFKTLDYPLWLELSLKTRFKYINVATTTYRIVQKSISNNSDVDKNFEFIFNSLTIVNYILHKHNLNINSNKYIKNTCIIQCVKYYCKHNKVKEAINCAKKIKCFSIQDFTRKAFLTNRYIILFLNKFYFK